MGSLALAAVMLCWWSPSSAEAASPSVRALAEVVESERAGDIEKAESALLTYLGSADGQAQPPAQRTSLFARAAELARRLKAPARAAKHYGAAIEAHREAFGATEPGLLPLLEARLDCFVEARDAKGARRVADDVARVAAALHGETSKALAPVYEYLALKLDEVGSKEAAQQYRARARFVANGASSRGLGSASFTLVELFYATSRASRPREAPGISIAYTSQPGPLSYGKATVSVPAGHTIGKVESPSWWRLEFRPDPDRHVVLSGLETLDETGFFGSVKGRVGQSTRGEVLVFVHGYNTSFDQAARRAAVLAHDLRVDGAPILYSWPSMGDATSYVADITKCDDTEWTTLAGFLDDVASRTGAKRIQVVAHSLGNCMLVGALDKLATGQVGEAPPPRFDEVVLAAPDVSRRDFTQARADRLRTIAGRLSVYTSNRDLALEASRTLRQSEARLGDSDPPYALEGVDFVDASQAPADMLGHLHFAEGGLDDLRALLWSGAPASRRCLLRPTGPTWVFVPDACDREALRTAAAMIRVHGADSAVKRLSTSANEASRQVLAMARALAGVAD